MQILNKCSLLFLLVGEFQSNVNISGQNAKRPRDRNGDGMKQT